MRVGGTVPSQFALPSCRKGTAWRVWPATQVPAAWNQDCRCDQTLTKIDQCRAWSLGHLVLWSSPLTRLEDGPTAICPYDDNHDSHNQGHKDLIHGTAHRSMGPIAHPRRHHGWRQAGRKKQTAGYHRDGNYLCPPPPPHVQHHHHHHHHRHYHQAMHACDGGLQPAYAASYAAAVM